MTPRHVVFLKWENPTKKFVSLARIAEFCFTLQIELINIFSFLFFFNKKEWNKNRKSVRWRHCIELIRFLYREFLSVTIFTEEEFLLFYRKLLNCKDFSLVVGSTNVVTPLTIRALFFVQVFVFVITTKKLDYENYRQINRKINIMLYI